MRSHSEPHPGRRAPGGGGGERGGGRGGGRRQIPTLPRCVCPKRKDMGYFFDFKGVNWTRIFHSK